MDQKPYVLGFLRSPFFAASVATVSVMLFFSSILFSQLERFSGNFSGFLHLKTRFLRFNPIVSKMDEVRRTLLTFPTGYDTVFYYSITFDPFLTRFKENPDIYQLMVDEPRVRYVRIGYPMLVKFLSLDRPLHYPKTMVLLILISHVVAVLFLVKIFVFWKKSPYWALFYILVPGFTLSFMRALPESIAAAAMLAGLYFYIKNSLKLAVVLLALGLLIRESVLIVILSVSVYELFVSKNKRRAFVLLCSVLPYGLWKLYLTYRLFPIYGWTTMFYSPQVITIPFAGIIELYQNLLSGNYPEGKVQAGYLFPILLSVVSIFSLFLLIQQRTAFTIGLFLYSFIALSLGYEKSWSSLGNAERTTFEAFLFLPLALGSVDVNPKQRYAITFLAIAISVFIYNYCFLTMSNAFRRGLLLDGFL